MAMSGVSAEPTRSSGPTVAEAEGGKPSPVERRRASASTAPTLLFQIKRGAKPALKHTGNPTAPRRKEKAGRKGGHIAHDPDITGHSAIYTTPERLHACKATPLIQGAGDCIPALPGHRRGGGHT